MMMFLCLLVFCALEASGAVFSDNVMFQNKCIDDLGCFYTGPPFYHPIYRPVSLAPSDNIKPKFLLFTRENPQQEEELSCTKESLDSSSLNPMLPVNVLVHGYSTTLRLKLKPNDILHQIKDALLNENDCNVILLDWTDYSVPPYEQAVADGRVVGALLAKLLKLIMNSSVMQPKDIYLIGHSLGVPVVAWAGERIPHLGRITGLDPAVPYFLQAPPEVRLDRTDAEFVDVIHTAGIAMLGIASDTPVGHMDFYPNGGRSQPGCSVSPYRFGGKMLSITCSHLRVVELFLESIDNSKCKFLAAKCESYHDFEKGYCPSENSTTAEMGFHGKKLQGLPTISKFFLKTSPKSPFCIDKEKKRET